jgi:hypothetical protein
MQLDLYNPRGYYSHKLLPQEYPVGTYNFTVYNFGPAARVGITCLDTLSGEYMQTFVVYPGRNLICACRLQKECYITIHCVEEDSLIQMENGTFTKLNYQLYQGAHGKTYIPSLREICISNVYSLNWEWLFGTDHCLLPKTIIENPPQYVKRCVESFCILSYFARCDKNACYRKIGNCMGSGLPTVGKPNCPCKYCKSFNLFPFSLHLRGGALPEGSSDLLVSLPADPSGPEEASPRYGCLPCAIL